MSVCIAAISDDKKIVVSSDLMVSLLGGAFSADLSLIKGREIALQQWAIGFAGDDIGRVKPLVARVKHALVGVDELSAEAVASAVLKSYHAERSALAVETHL